MSSRVIARHLSPQIDGPHPALASNLPGDGFMCRLMDKLRPALDAISPTIRAMKSSPSSIAPPPKRAPAPRLAVRPGPALLDPTANSQYAPRYFPAENQLQERPTHRFPKYPSKRVHFFRPDAPPSRRLIIKNMKASVVLEAVPDHPQRRGAPPWPGVQPVCANTNSSVGCGQVRGQPPASRRVAFPCSPQCA
jgi:hypothetical protein